MATSIGTATGYKDLLARLRTFLTGATIATPAGPGAAAVVGGGTFAAGPYFWKVTALNALGESLPSVEVTATIALNGSATITWTAVAGATGYRIYRGTGAGTETAYQAVGAVVTFTDTGAAGTAATPPITNTSGPGWTSLRYTVGGAGLTDECILQAPGLGGSDQIFVGIQTFENVTADYYNFRLAGFTGFDAALAFGAQPGVMNNVFLTLWNSPIPYWFIANGRRVIIVAKVSTSYVMGYLGFINQYPSPNQFPYPIAIGGNLAQSPEPIATSVNWRWSNATFLNTNFPMSTRWSPGGGTNPVNTCTLRLRKPNGIWADLASGDSGTYTDADQYNIWPYMSGMANVQQNLGAVQSPVFPVILHDNTPEVYGELDGLGATSGQAVASEDTLTVGVDSWLVVQNVSRTGRNQYCAVRLV